MLKSQADPGAECPVEVSRPAMYHRWDDVSFLHWRRPPAEVQKLVPAGVEVDVFDGSAWLSVLPFVLTVRLAGIPWTWRFPETNLRTYVRTPDGIPAIWFLSLDAAELRGVVAGRIYGLPYRWARMSVSGAGIVRHYRTERRRARVSMDLSVEVGEPVSGDALDHFLTARWVLLAERRGRLGVTLAQHDPWPLHRARVLSLSQDLLPDAGLPELAHYSPGTAVRMGRRRARD